jgi:phage-related minor tail protein
VIVHRFRKEEKMKLGIKAGIVTAASVALIGGAAFAAPSFAVDSVETEPTQSQEMRQLHKGESSSERAAQRAEKKAEWEQMTDEEKAAHKAERAALRAEKKADWEQMTDEEKAAHKAEKRAEWEQMTDEEKAAHKAERQAKQAGAKGEGKRMGQAKGKGPHSES